MASKQCDKSNRESMTVVELMDMFPTEETAVAWFEECLWPVERHCGKCGSLRTREVPNAKPMPYWCTDCRSYFSVRTGTPMARSNVPMRKWAIAIYLCLTSLKSVSSKKLARDIGVNKNTAWFMMMRIREAWGEADDDEDFDGPVEADETYMGGERRNMSNEKRKAIRGAGSPRGPVGKTAVVGVKDRDSNEVRAEVVQRTDGATLQGFVREHTEPGATVYTDDAAAYPIASGQRRAGASLLPAPTKSMPIIRATSHDPLAVAEPDDAGGFACELDGVSPAPVSIVPRSQGPGQGVVVAPRED